MDCRLDISIVVMSNFLTFITVLCLYEIISLFLGNSGVLKIKGQLYIDATNLQMVEIK